MTNTDIDLKYTSYHSETELDEEDRMLITQAREASESSYSPYSHFQVGAAVLLESGAIVKGSNQENSSFPSGLCAEQVALFHAGSNYNGVAVKKIAITARRSDSDTFVPVSPCGSCRQVMIEYEFKQNLPIEILMQVAVNKWVKTHSAEMLLPFCFNKNSL